MAEPDGWVIVGEPYWLREPSDEHLRELFHRIWHRTRAGLSNGLLGGKGQRGLPQL
jgi:hypothetical protein